MAMSSPSVAVVIPTHNRASLLRRTLTSVLAQREVDLEVVIVDDGSDASEAREVRRYEQERFRVVRNDDARGVGAARNLGAGATTASWLAFCDDDDLWTPTKLARQISAAETAGRLWAYTGAVKFEFGPVVWQLMPPPDPQAVADRLPYQNVIPAGSSNVLVHRAALMEAGGFDAGLWHLADWDMWLRLLQLGPPAHAPGLGVGYRLHPSAMSLTPEGVLDDLKVLDARWRHLRQGQPLDYGPTHLWIALNQLRAGRRTPAALSYLRAIRHGRRRGFAGLLHALDPRTTRGGTSAALDTWVARAAGIERVDRSELPAEVRDLLDALASDEQPRPAPR
jgi:glycosyltransferase involved in cell wall biosynthesis